MTDFAGPGPYKVYAGDPPVPLYVIPFDKAGSCTAPQTREALLQEAQQGDYTDLFVFSHGWNNDWATATTRYDHFFQNYTAMRADLRLTYGREFKPLLVGIFWPSTALVMPSEQAPGMAGAAAAAAADVGLDTEWLDELSPDVRPRVHELLNARRRLGGAESRELAAHLAPLWNRLQRAGTDDTDLPVAPIDASELAALWAASSAAAEEEDPAGGRADSTATPDPQAALSFRDLLGAPRDLLRVFTVLQMKDRGLQVGGSGVGTLLHDLMARTPARVHLIGHSYGCLVVLSALAAAAKAGARKADSALLLQAAVSRYCFAQQVPGKDYAGGYRTVLSHVKQPILATRSRQDLPLRHLFHLAVRRDRDLGQPGIAGDTPAPSKYAALGGYGPAGCLESEHHDLLIHNVGVPYTLADSPRRLISLQADVEIKGHGDISVAETWWALYEQVRQS